MTEPGKTVIVTGATGAIGKAIARLIAAEPGYEVALVCRDESKGKRAVDEIITATSNGHVSYLLADLSRRAEIDALAAQWDGPLHVLINNAAQSPRGRQETPEGLERQFATNIMSYVWMMNAFRPFLTDATPSRVVNVASYWAGGLELDDLEFKRRRYNNDAAYRQSKQANRMLSVAYATRWKDLGIAVNAAHSGDVNSKLSNDLGFGGHETPDQGAATPVWLATAPVGAENTGKYFEHMREKTCQFSRDSAAVEALYEYCQTT